MQSSYLTSTRPTSTLLIPYLNHCQRSRSQLLLACSLFFNSTQSILCPLALFHSCDRVQTTVAKDFPSPTTKSTDHDSARRSEMRLVSIAAAVCFRQHPHGDGWLLTRVSNLPHPGGPSFLAHKRTTTTTGWTLASSVRPRSCRIIWMSSATSPVVFTGSSSPRSCCPLR